MGISIVNLCQQNQKKMQYILCQMRAGETMAITGIAVQSARRRRREMPTKSEMLKVLDHEIEFLEDDVKWHKEHDVYTDQDEWVIDVYKRNTNVISGWFVNGADVVIKNIGRYAVSETSLDLPSHTSSTTSITKPHFDNIQTEVNFSNVLEELKQKQKTIDLSIQGKKISHYIPLVPYFSDDDISESLPSDYSYYDSSSDEDSTMW